jgi:hypothetical protein
LEENLPPGTACPMLLEIEEGEYTEKDRIVKNVRYRVRIRVKSNHGNPNGITPWEGTNIDTTIGVSRMKIVDKDKESLTLAITCCSKCNGKCDNFRLVCKCKRKIVMRIDAETSLFDIIDLMRRPQGASVQEICTTLGCQRTTFYRYQEKLNAFGIPYYNKDDLQGNTSSKRWFIDEAEYKRTIPVKLDHVERMMLRTILGRTRVFDGTRLKPKRRDFDQTQFYITHDRTKRIATTVYSFKGSVSYEGKEDIIDTLCACIEEHTRATVCYQAANHQTQDLRD